MEEIYINDDDSGDELLDLLTQTALNDSSLIVLPKQHSIIHDNNIIQDIYNNDPPPINLSQLETFLSNLSEKKEKIDVSAQQKGQKHKQQEQQQQQQSHNNILDTRQLPTFSEFNSTTTSSIENSSPFTKHYHYYQHYSTFQNQSRSINNDNYNYNHINTFLNPTAPKFLPTNLSLLSLLFSPINQQLNDIDLFFLQLCILFIIISFFVILCTYCLWRYYQTTLNTILYQVKESELYYQAFKEYNEEMTKLNKNGQNKIVILTYEQYQLYQQHLKQQNQQEQLRETIS